VWLSFYQATATSDRARRASKGEVAVRELRQGKIENAKWKTQNERRAAGHANAFIDLRFPFCIFYFALLALRARRSRRRLRTIARLSL
jgi:hypothetical protein